MKLLRCKTLQRNIKSVRNEMENNIKSEPKNKKSVVVCVRGMYNGATETNMFSVCS